MENQDQHWASGFTLSTPLPGRESTVGVLLYFWINIALVKPDPGKSTLKNEYLLGVTSSLKNHVGTSEHKSQRYFLVSLQKRTQPYKYYTPIVNCQKAPTYGVSIQLRYGSLSVKARFEVREAGEARFSRGSLVGLRSSKRKWPWRYVLCKQNPMHPNVKSNDLQTFLNIFEHELKSQHPSQWKSLLKMISRQHPSHLGERLEEHCRNRWSKFALNRTTLFVQNETYTWIILSLPIMSGSTHSPCHPTSAHSSHHTVPAQAKHSSNRRNNIVHQGTSSQFIFTRCEQSRNHFNKANKFTTLCRFAENQPPCKDCWLCNSKMFFHIISYLYLRKIRKVKNGEATPIAEEATKSSLMSLRPVDSVESLYKCYAIDWMGGTLAHQDLCKPPLGPFG